MTSLGLDLKNKDLDWTCDLTFCFIDLALLIYRAVFVEFVLVFSLRRNRHQIKCEIKWSPMEAGDILKITSVFQI